MFVVVDGEEVELRMLRDGEIAGNHASPIAGWCTWLETGWSEPIPKGIDPRGEEVKIRRELERSKGVEAEV